MKANEMTASPPPTTGRRIGEAIGLIAFLFGVAVLLGLV